MKHIRLFFILLGGLLLSGSPSFPQGHVLNAESYKHYIDSFNVNDKEIYKEFIPNDKSWEFLSGNIPLFDCPDKQMEQVYYFRWWTYRKHIKKTSNGFVITEFLPNVPWAGKENTISCAAAHHFYEGRWLHNSEYLNDYARFWFRGGGNPRLYSFWVADAIYNQFLVNNDTSLVKDLLPDLVNNYKAWEKAKLDSTGLFWQIDDRDGMEMSVCGSGYRPTINSYLYGDAVAISKIASMLGENETALLFAKKATDLKQLLQNKLWDANASFFKVLPRGPGSNLCGARELQGYTPWYFNIPDKGYAGAWKYLMDPNCFYAPYGPTTVEQNHPGFKISYEGHECQWNGPSWPYATSVTLTAMANLLNNYSQTYVSRDDYVKLLTIYSGSQQLKMKDGSVVPWIDENLNPLTGDWISRTRLKNWKNGTWYRSKGGEERGKDYNHSSFCDLIISGLIGIRPQADHSLLVNPLVPKNYWDYFCLDNLLYKGHTITILFDKKGTHYKKGKGFKIFVDGKLSRESTKTGRLRINL